MRETDNFDEVFGWAKTTGDAESGLQLAFGLWGIWWLRGAFEQGLTRLRPLLALAERRAGTFSDQTLSEGYREACGLSEARGELDAAELFNNKGSPRSAAHERAFGTRCVMIDIFSRFVVGWSLVTRSNAKIAAHFFSEIVEREKLQPGQAIIHNDRGTEMTAETFCDKLDALGMTRSLSRPQVRDDNFFSEAAFKTLKYYRDYPDRFGSPEDARSYFRRFFPAYNYEHRHSGIAMLTPACNGSQRPGRCGSPCSTRRDARCLFSKPERFVNGQPVCKSLPGEVFRSIARQRMKRQRNHLITHSFLETLVSTPLTSSDLLSGCCVGVEAPTHGVQSFLSATLVQNDKLVALLGSQNGLAAVLYWRSSMGYAPVRDER